MKKKLTYVLLAAVVLIGGAVVSWSGVLSPVDDGERAKAIAKAEERYLQLQAAGADFSAGPCIAEELMPDWAADVAHDPRTAEDDLAENQCRSYREGKARHFVELDPQGNLIRAR